MFERFSDGARRAIVRGLAEARLLGHDYVGTEHVLIAMASDCDALAAAGVTTERARTAAADVAATSHVPALRDDGPYTVRLGHVFDFARRQALRLGHRHVANGHLVMGIIRLGEGNGLLLLKHLDVDIDGLRQAVEDRLHADQPPEPPRQHEPSLATTSYMGITARTVPAEASAPPPRVAEPGASDRACSFCEHAMVDGDVFVAGPRATICAACARACAQLLGGRRSD